MKAFTLGPGAQDAVTVSVIGYAGEPIGDTYDDNWLRCEIAVHAGAFSGCFPANLLSFELRDLLQGLGDLHETLRGEYAFSAMEGQLAFKATCGSLGHLVIEGHAMDEPGIGHTLTFGFSLDQTYLAQTLRQLAEVMRAFPVRT